MIGLIGISYKTAPIEKREQFSFSQDEILPFADFLQKETGISDLVLLSTCNRTELYISQTSLDRLSASERIIEAIKKFKGTEGQCSRYFYHKFDLEAVKHLFKVASGLESMIIGEDQIIGQLKDAYVYCTENALTDAVLMRLFQKSFEAGKRARTETGIKLGNLSVSSTAVELCLQEMGCLNDKSVLVVGAGDTGSLTLQNMYKRGIGASTIINRSASKAKILAEKFNSKVSSFLKLDKELKYHDVVVVATRAPHYVITRKMVEKARQQSGKPVIMIDLSVPRNIDPEIAQLDGVKMYAVDDMQKVISENTEKRKEAAQKAETIIEEVANEFNDWMTSRSLRPAIKAISNNLEGVYRQELENFKNIDSEEIKHAVDEYTKHIVQRYTRLLIKNLKDLTDNGRNTDSLHIINELFKLEDNNRRK